MTFIIAREEFRQRSCLILMAFEYLYLVELVRNAELKDRFFPLTNLNTEFELLPNQKKYNNKFYLCVELMRRSSFRVTSDVTSSVELSSAL